MPSSPDRRPDRAPQRLWQLLVVMALVQTAIAVARPVATYRALDLGAGATEVGLLGGAFALLPVVVALPLGRLVDRWRPEPVLVGGVLLLAAGAVVLASSGSLLQIAAGNVVLGLGTLACVVGGESSVARLPPTAMDRGFGLFTAVVSVGQLVGPLLAGGLLASAPDDLSEGTSRALLVSAAICVATLPPVVWSSLHRGPVGGRRTEPGRRTAARAVLGCPGVPSRLFTSLVLAATVDLLTTYLPLLGEERGIAPSTVGVLLSIRAAATMASRVLAPQLLVLLSRSRLVVLSTLGSGVLVASVPATGDVPVLAVLLAATGFLLGVGQPLMMTMLVRSVPDEARGTALALRLVGHRIGAVSTPAAAGVLAGAAGVPAAFWLLAALLATATVGARELEVPG